MGAKRAFQERQGQMLDNQEDMGDWWRMEMGRELGAETVVAEEATRLTANNLAALSGRIPCTSPQDNKAVHCRSSTAHCPRAVRQCIAGVALPTAPGQ